MRLAARIEFESCFTHLVKPPATVWFAYHIGNANLTQEQLNCGAVELLSIGSTIELNRHTGRRSLSGENLAGVGD